MKKGKQGMLTLFLLVCVTALISGCGILSTESKVLFVPESNGMVRIGSDVSGHVYTLQDGEWIRSPNKVQLPEGWYAGSLEDEGYE
jgi:hypothetical protein